ncbi:aminotransferase class I/II-fold pyridoxal phosphate-dependent enzyme, partial [Streptomyces sp. NPDC058471]|uniref:aminotransferase class I/II-fold pyridoxal phosphate-dependent enzyme n=1 Tax=Streptomyces sp. NPDC058471 TaxID=3346516 RepID=UPI0036494651
MHRPPPRPEADCLTAFSRLRDGSPTNTPEIGEGCNRFPPATFLGQYFGRLMHQLTAEGALSRYADPFAGGAHRTVAELLRGHWDIPLEPHDVFFTLGGTEAINLTIEYLAAAGTRLILPLPNYYAFDQAAARWGATVASYYRHDGQLHHNRAPAARATAIVEVLPNGVTGSFHTTPHCPDPDFTLLDVVIQAGALSDACSPTATLRRRVQQLDLDRSAIIMTASKDLSLPGLRAAAVITRNRGLRAHLAHDAFDRTAATNPLGGVLMAVYASLLPLLDAPSEQIEKLVGIAQDAASATALPSLPALAGYRSLLRHLSAMA